jgi:hypothetical protein
VSSQYNVATELNSITRVYCIPITVDRVLRTCAPFRPRCPRQDGLRIHLPLYQGNEPSSQVLVPAANPAVGFTFFETRPFPSRGLGPAARPLLWPRVACSNYHLRSGVLDGTPPARSFTKPLSLSCASPRLALQFPVLFADQAEFFDANGINEPRNTTYERLAELSGAVKTELPNQLQVRDKLGPHGSLNSGNAVTNDLKVIVEMAGLVGGP